MYFPEKVGRYHNRDLIGVGGFAAVVRCFDEALDSMVTIKVLLENWSASADIRARFLQEAKLLRRIRNEHVVTVHDIGELDDGRPYFVMEYADRGSLEQRLEAFASERKIDAASIAQIVNALAEGLGALHSAEIVHRDIKPANILIRSADGTISASRDKTIIQSTLLAPDEHILIGDLGLAKVTTPSQLASAEKFVSNPTIIGGSAGYQSPEQTQPNGQISFATDIYAATAVVWRLTTGVTPPAQSQIADVLKTIEAPWREIFTQGLASNPDDRHSTIEVWRNVITSALADSDTLLRPVAQSGAGNAAAVLCPYKGLAAYQPEDAEFYCGREALVDQLIGRLNSNRILVVAGPSGSGKSSLVRAGLIPAIKMGALPDSAQWRIALFTPGADPLAELHFQLSKNNKERACSLDELRQQPTLARRLAADDESVLICIDQFEELFTLCHNKQDRQLFFDALAAHIDPADSHSHVVIAVRADFYGNCAMFPWLARKVSDNQVLVGPMERNELRRAIEKPAKRAGLALEDGLVEAILDEAGNDPGALPLVAHLLVETWARRRHNTLTLVGFSAAGGVAGAISKSADTIYEQEFDQQQKAVARRLLLRLVTPGEGAADTRRRLDIESLSRDEQPELMHQLVERLTKARLLTVDDNTVEVAHEALIRTWPRFRGWIEEERDNLRLRQRIDRNASEWDASQRDQDFLYRGTPLATALEWKIHHGSELSQLGAEFLDKSDAVQQAAIEKEKQQQLRSNKIRRMSIGALALLALLAGISSIIAMSALRTSRVNEKIAAAASIESNERFVRALATSSVSLVESDPYAALILAAESNTRSMAPSIEARSLLIESRNALSNATLIPFASPIKVGDAYSAAIHPLGTIIATGDRSGEIKLWDFESGLLLSRLNGHQFGVEKITFSPDGMLLASGDLDGSLLLWKVAKPKRVPPPAQLMSRAGEVWGVAFSHDGKLLASASEDGTARLFDVNTGAQQGQPLVKQLGGFNSIAFSPDDSLLVAGGGQGVIRSWDVATRKQIWANTKQKLSAVRELHFSHDGSLISLRSDSDTRLLNSADGTPLDLRPFSNISGLDLQSERGGFFMPDNETMINGAGDGKIYLWNMQTAEHTFTSRLGHASGIEHIALSKDGAKLISLGQDQQLRRWHFKPKLALTQLIGKHVNGLNAIALDPQANHVIAGGNSDVITLLPTKGGASKTLVRDAAKIQTLAFHPNGAQFVAGYEDGSVQIRSVDNASLTTIQAHQSAITHLAYHPNGKIFATGATDGLLQLWSTSDGSSIGEPLGPHTGGVTRIAFSPDGAEFAVASLSGVVRIWQTQDQKNLVDFNADDNTIWSVAYNALGDTLVTASDDEVVAIWERKSLKQLHTLSGHDAGATDAQFSPDGRTLLTSARNGAIRLWDSASMEQIGSPLRLHKKSVWQIAWLPDSQHFVSASVNGNIHLWNILSIERACELGKTAFDQKMIVRYLGEDAKLEACP
jgi:WD40 repeat protein/serine/threonine protein kinase